MKRDARIALGLISLAPFLQAQGVITSVAGSKFLFRGDGGPAQAAPLGEAMSVAVDAGGTLFIPDASNHLVVQVSKNGVLSVLAGNGINGFSGDGGPATSAALNRPSGVAVDEEGAVYIADTYNHRVRKVSADGIITTVAGNGFADFSGDGGPATSASLSFPTALALDANTGSLYVADTGNHMIREITPGGRIFTVAGALFQVEEPQSSGGAPPALPPPRNEEGEPALFVNLFYPSGLALDGAGNLYIADSWNHRIRKLDWTGMIITVAGTGQEGFSGDGGRATGATLKFPRGVAVDRDGSLYIADYSNHLVRKVGPDGRIHTVAGTVPNASGTRQLGFSGDGGPAIKARLSSPHGVAIDAEGNLYIADLGNRRVRRVTAAGAISTAAGSGVRFFGDGGPAQSASLNLPDGIAVAGSGTLYIADQLNHRVRRVSASGIITTVAGNGVQGYTADGGKAVEASLSAPFDVALDAAGNLYIADSGNHRIRKVSPEGFITTVAGNGIEGFSGDGGPASRGSLSSPQGVLAGPFGELYIADTGNHRIRRVWPDGTIATVAGNGNRGFAGDAGPAIAAALNTPRDVWQDPAGNFYIADTSNHRIRKVTPWGVITTVAGTGEASFNGDDGPATEIALAFPNGLSAGEAGSFYVADYANHRIRRVVPGGNMTTVAGTIEGFSGDGGPALEAELSRPTRVAVDPTGNLYITDSGNDRVRKILASRPSFTASPATLSFSCASGASAASQQLILGGGVAGLIWQGSVRTDRGDWLSLSANAGRAPYSISVSANADNLAAGAYKGWIEIAAPEATPPVVIIVVSFTVSAAEPARMSAEPSGLSFQVVAGAAAPPTQLLRVGNTGGGSLGWTAEAFSTGVNWLSIRPASGRVRNQAPGVVEVGANPAGLAAGSYVGTIHVRSAETGQSLSVPVSLLIAAPAGVLLLDRTNLLFRAVEGGGLEPPQTFRVLNIGGGAVDWSADTAVPWLGIAPGGGRSEANGAEASISVDPSGLAAGFYTGLIRVTSPEANNSPQVLRADLQVLPRGSRLGAVVRPTSLVFTAVEGGSSPGSQQVIVTAADLVDAAFVSIVDAPWVKRVPDSGTAAAGGPARIVVQPELGSLAAGIYRATLTVRTQDDGALHPVRLLFVVSPARATRLALARASAAGSRSTGAFEEPGACAPARLLLEFTSVFRSFSSIAGWPTALHVKARDDCGSPAAGGSVLVSFSNGDPPVVLTDLHNGEYIGNWRPGDAAERSVVVTAHGNWRGLQSREVATAEIAANPNSGAATLNLEGILLEAGLEPGPVAPGSIVSLFGRNLSVAAHHSSSVPLANTLGGVRVLIGGLSAPLLYVGPERVTFQIPAELPADRRLQVVLVDAGGVPSVPQPLQTAANRPGIFTLGPPFGNQGRIMIANTGRLAMPFTPDVPSEPVEAGSHISVYCTGLGSTDPPVASGQPGAATAPFTTVSTPVSVSIGGKEASVSFAGIAPGMVGVYQVNAQVPEGVLSGSEVPVVITQAGARSNTATIAVR